MVLQFLDQIRNIRHNLDIIYGNIDKINVEPEMINQPTSNVLFEIEIPPRKVTYKLISIELVNVC